MTERNAEILLQNSGLKRAGEIFAQNLLLTPSSTVFPIKKIFLPYKVRPMENTAWPSAVQTTSIRNMITDYFMASSTG